MLYCNSISNSKFIFTKLAFDEKDNRGCVFPPPVCCFLKVCIMNIDIGNRIKLLRLFYGLTQQELADRCELSKGFISQLESNQTAPSLATLSDIFDALGTTFEEFFAQTGDQNPVYKAEDMCVKNVDGIGNMTWLVSTAQKNEMEPILYEILPGQETPVDMPHAGEEFGYVLAGSIILRLGMQTSKLSKGDAFYFAADKQHSIKNRGKTTAKILWVSTPPTF